MVQRYVQLADAALPGCIEGLYLVGSLALNDYRASRSDIDFVAVTRAALRPEELDTIQRVHSRLARERRKPSFSGIYVTWAELRRNPVELQDVPFHLEGRFGRTGGFDANPSIWLTLHRYPTAVRGPASPAVWHDLDAVRRWNVENLNSYWQRWVSHHRGVFERGAYLLTDQSVAWCVPGVARLHYTVTSGDITSKTGACEYALATFPPQWHPVIREALRIRTGEPVRQQNRLARRRDALGFVQFVIDDANELVKRA